MQYLSDLRPQCRYRAPFKLQGKRQEISLVFHTSTRSFHTLNLSFQISFNPFPTNTYILTTEMGSANPALDNHVSGQSNKPLSQPAHALKWSQVAEKLSADTDDGLSSTEAKQRLENYGANELGEADGVNPGKILLRQIANAMTLVLILAMAVSFGIQSWIEGGVIAGVIFINIAVGFFQEFHAAKTMDSLKSLSSPTAMAVRDGQSVSVPTTEIVPGDMVELKTGDTIPADVRLVEAVNFETDEALLTGESLPVRKATEDVFDSDTGPGDRLNVAYSSSTVTKGRATGICFATGMYTEIGSIAAALRKKDSKVRSVKRNPDETAQPHRYMQAAILTCSDAVGHFLGVNVGTPLQKKLSRLAVLLFCIAVVCAIIVLGANEFRSDQEVVIYAVATGLSMIPASLVVVLTITMAAGTKRMVERHVIVSKYIHFYLPLRVYSRTTQQRHPRSHFGGNGLAVATDRILRKSTIP